MIRVVFGANISPQKFVLHFLRQGQYKSVLDSDIQQQPYQIPRLILGVCAIMLLSVTLLGNSPVLARRDHAPRYQESPLSPLSTPITATIPMISPLPVTAPLPITATVSVTDTMVESAAEPTAAPAVALINRGQTSLLLVGAVLVGILIVVGLVMGRQR